MIRWDLMEEYEVNYFKKKKKRHPVLYFFSLSSQWAE